MASCIPGFDIVTRKLTTKEELLEITWERFRDFHYKAGEDFLDITGEGNATIFGGWLLHKYSGCSAEILDILNDKRLEIQSFRDLSFFYHDDKRDIDIIYLDFAEFCNQTTHLKIRVNTILIVLDEFYN